LLAEELPEPDCPRHAVERELAEKSISTAEKAEASMLATKKVLTYVRNFGLYRLGDGNNSAWLLTAFLVILGAAAFAVSACASGGGGGESGEPVTVRVGTAQSASDAAIFIADKQGYFEEQGI
jgi:hypothetical protein